MKKRLISMALIALFLMVIFSACDDLEVTVIRNQASAPSKVEAKTVGNNNWVVVTWPAAKDAIYYDVYIQKKGTKTISKRTDNDAPNDVSPTNEVSYSGSAQTPYYTEERNTDPDKWTVLIDVAKSSDAYAGGVYGGSEFRFGVSAITADENLAKSNIKWSSYITIDNP